MLLLLRVVLAAVADGENMARLEEEEGEGPPSLVSRELAPPPGEARPRAVLPTGLRAEGEERPPAPAPLALAGTARTCRRGPADPADPGMRLAVEEAGRRRVVSARRCSGDPETPPLPPPPPVPPPRSARMPSPVSVATEICAARDAIRCTSCWCLRSICSMASLGDPGAVFAIDPDRVGGGRSKKIDGKPCEGDVRSGGRMG